VIDFTTAFLVYNMSVVDGSRVLLMSLKLWRPKSLRCLACQKMEQSRLPFPHEDKLKPKGKIIREMTENKVLRIARGTVLGGAKLGAFVALFSGVQHGLAVHRSTHDALNTVAAGAITGGSFSLTCIAYTHLKAVSLLNVHPKLRLLLFIVLVEKFILSHDVLLFLICISLICKL
jgi:hypothetical protein